MGPCSVASAIGEVVVYGAIRGRRPAVAVAVAVAVRGGAGWWRTSVDRGRGARP